MDWKQQSREVFVVGGGAAGLIAATGAGLGIEIAVLADLERQCVPARSTDNKQAMAV